MALDLQPTLSGRLLTLRPLRADDFEALYACASDPKVWEQHPKWNRYQRDVFRALFDDGLRSGGALIAIEKELGQIIGSSRFYKYEANSVLIGYTFLACKYWGGQYNGEMKALMLEHAFKSVDQVFFEIGETNTRSRKAIERIGAELVRSQPCDGDPHVLYRILKS